MAILRRGAGPHARLPFALALVALAASVCLHGAGAVPLPVPGDGAQRAREYEIKAAFLLNFCKFVDWPASAPAGPEGRFTFGVLGDDPFGSSLDVIINGKQIGGRPAGVRRGRRVNDLTGAQIVFVAGDDAAGADAVSALSGMPVLTVGESVHFADAGGIIQFVNEGARVKFVVNDRSARKSGLHISANLLALATRVISAAGDVR